MKEDQKNWAGNYQYSAEKVLHPKTVEEVQAFVAKSQKAKALGTRHSFNSIADTFTDHISTKSLNKILSLDQDRAQVVVEGGIAYGELAEFLNQNGFGLANLASLPHISVAGACATATHGSGVRNQNLAAAVAAMDIVIADGSIVTLERGTEEFDGAVVNLGGLGIVTRVTLDLVPSFNVSQAVYDNLPMSSADDHLDQILSGGYSVSLFTNWDSGYFEQVWIKRLESENSFEPTYFEATLADSPRHMIPTMPFENCTTQLGIPGPWHFRLPHFKMEFTPSGGEELQTEFFVERSKGAAAIQAVRELKDQISPLLYVTEIRTVAADSLWMSPAYQQDCLAIHFTWRQLVPEVTALIPKIEAQLAPFQPRPHWGKIFSMNAQTLERAFPKMAEFRKLLQSYDPTGKFRNPFLDTYVFG